jgi:hypothetical protein
MVHIQLNGCNIFNVFFSCMCKLLTEIGWNIYTIEHEAVQPPKCNIFPLLSTNVYGLSNTMLNVSKCNIFPLLFTNVYIRIIFHVLLSISSLLAYYVPILCLLGSITLSHAVSPMIHIAVYRAIRHVKGMDNLYLIFYKCLLYCFTKKFGSTKDRGRVPRRAPKSSGCKLC